MTIRSIGTSITDRPSRYAKQLTAHMSRRHGGEWNADSSTGWIDLLKGRAELSCEGEGEDAKVVISLTSADEETAGFLEDVIERHLVKFGVKDGLTMTWQRA